MSKLFAIQLTFEAKWPKEPMKIAAKGIETWNPTEVVIVFQPQAYLEMSQPPLLHVKSQPQLKLKQGHHSLESHNCPTAFMKVWLSRLGYVTMMERIHTTSNCTKSTVGLWYSKVWN